MTNSSNRLSQADLLFIRAVSASDAGDYAHAAEILQEILASFSEYGKAWCELGWIWLNQVQDLPRADDCFKKSIELSPGHASAYVGRAEVLFRLQKFAETNALLNQALEIEGTERDTVTYRLAMLMESQGRYDEASAQYQKAIKLTFSDELVALCEAASRRCLMKSGKP